MSRIKTFSEHPVRAIMAGCLLMTFPVIFFWYCIVTQEITDDNYITLALMMNEHHEIKPWVEDALSDGKISRRDFSLIEKAWVDLALDDVR